MQLIYVFLLSSSVGIDIKLYSRDNVQEDFLGKQKLECPNILSHE